MNDTHGSPPLAFEPPIDHAELCARLRFPLDEVARLDPQAQERRDQAVQELRTSIRRQGVRASRLVTPRIHGIVCEASRRLLLTQEPELYVVASPELNAFATTTSDGSPFVVLQNGVVQLLSDDELLAVVAHELGHSGLKHAVGDDENPVSYLYAAHRSAAGEVSADRVGMFACGSPATLTRGLIKLQCGLPDKELRIDIETILEQYLHPGNVPPGEDQIGSHPELPFRYWAMTRFAESDIYQSLCGRPGGIPFAQVEAEIEDRFQALDEGLAFLVTSELVHETVAWLGVLMVASDAQITELERSVLAEFIGRIWTDDVTAFVRRNGIEAARRRALKSLEDLKHASLRTRQRVYDLVRELGTRSENRERIEETLALVSAAFGATE